MTKVRTVLGSMFLAGLMLGGSVAQAKEGYFAAYRVNDTCEFNGWTNAWGPALWYCTR